MTLPARLMDEKEGVPRIAVNTKGHPQDRSGAESVVVRETESESERERVRQDLTNSRQLQDNGQEQASGIPRCHCMNLGQSTGEENRWSRVSTESQTPMHRS